MSKGLSPSLACRNLLDMCDSSLSGLIAKFESLPEDACSLILGYLDSISVLINRASGFIDQINLNPNFK